MRKIKLLVVTVLLVVVASVNCLASSVRVYRDNYGVPHIYSGNIAGLYYGWGYTSAQDRLFQLEMLKRIYYGQVSELFGEQYYAMDFYWRNEYPTKADLQLEFEKLDILYQNMIIAYADGINDWIDKVLKDQENKLPLEFHQLGILPEYWTPIDAAAAIMANLGLFMDINNELIHVEFYTYLKKTFGEKADDYFDDIAWINDESAYTTIQKGEINGEIKRQSNKNGRNAVNHQALPEIANLYTDKEHMISMALSALGYEIPTKIKQGASEAMSYCVVVGPEKSATGNTWLMSGPQVDWWVPGLVYEVGLHSGGIDVVGTTLIGAPYLMFGESRTTSFSTTAAAQNAVDIFEEKLNPANPLQYFYKGEWRDMEIRNEKFYIKGMKEPKNVTLYKTVHGPVVSQVDTNGDGKYEIAYSKKVSCYDSYLSAVAAYNELSFAQTPEQFIVASEMLGPTMNLLWADNKGNIAYYHAGKIPIRAEGIDPRFPTPGTGEYDWKGFLVAEDHPQIINPAYGVIVNWNNKPASMIDNGDMTSIFSWAAWSTDNHSNNLDRLINEKAPIDRKDLEDIVHEIADTELEARAVKEFLLQALEGNTNSDLLKAKELLSNWDNLRSDKNKDGYYDTAAITIFEEWWNVVNKNVFADEFGLYWDIFYRYGGLLYNYGGYSFFVRTILGDQAEVPVKNDFYNGRGWKTVFVESMEQAIANLKEQYTGELTTWLKPIKTMTFPSTHLTGVPTSFGSVPNIKYMDRGSQNHIVEGTWPVVTGKNVVPPGQSGFISKTGVKSPHFEDQLSLYANWQYKNMLMKREDVLINSVSSEILHYNLK